MSCYYCAQQKVNTSSRGHCAVCSFAVCTRPAQRPDGVFHAEACACGCGSLICEVHMYLHAQSHGGQVPQCFPFLTVLSAGAALDAAIQVLGGRIERTAILQLTRFINAVAPGTHSMTSQLEARLGRLPISMRDVPVSEEFEMPVLDFDVWGLPQDPFVRLPSGFFDESRGGRLLGLAVHALDMAQSTSKVDAAFLASLPKANRRGLAWWSALSLSEHRLEGDEIIEPAATFEWGSLTELVEGEHLQAPARPRRQAEWLLESAFMPPVQPDNLLGAVVGYGPLPRTEISKRVWDYIRKNRLQDAKNKRMINADDKLKKVFDGKTRVSMFEMTKLVKGHLKK